MIAEESSSFSLAQGNSPRYFYLQITSNGMEVRKSLIQVSYDANIVSRIFEPEIHRHFISKYALQVQVNFSLPK